MRHVALVLVLASLGCVGDPVGDPCVPESVPPGGFVATETYVETASPQCETRLCVVRGLAGDPSPGCTGDPCAAADEIREHVYCTVRCDDEGDCPEGFACDAVGDQGLCVRAP
jgi:hypothetical protein